MPPRAAACTPVCSCAVLDNPGSPTRPANACNSSILVNRIRCAKNSLGVNGALGDNSAKFNRLKASTWSGVSTLCVRINFFINASCVSLGNDAGSILLAFIQNISGIVNVPSKPPGMRTSRLLVKSVMPSDFGSVKVILTPCFSPQAFHSFSLPLRPGVVAGSAFILALVASASSIASCGTTPSSLYCFTPINDFTISLSPPTAASNAFFDNGIPPWSNANLRAAINASKPSFVIRPPTGLIPNPTGNPLVALINGPTIGATVIKAFAVSSGNKGTLALPMFVRGCPYDMRCMVCGMPVLSII